MESHIPGASAAAGTHQVAGVAQTAGSWPWVRGEQGPDGAVLLVPAIHVLHLSRACFSCTKHACAVPWHGGFACQVRADPERLLWGAARSLPCFLRKENLAQAPTQPSLRIFGGNLTLKLPCTGHIIMFGCSEPERSCT